MTLFFNHEQAAALLGTDVEGVKLLIRQGELRKTPDGIPADEVALFILGERFSLQTAKLADGISKHVMDDIGRTLRRHGGQPRLRLLAPREAESAGRE